MSEGSVASRLVRLVVWLAVVMSVDVARAETPEEKAERLRWFTDARFGMMIHFGVYSELGGVWNGTPTLVGGGENIQHNLSIPWSSYTAVAGEFVPSSFDAAAWVTAARDAGMKYLVVTTRHHDGFTLFDSAYSDWDIARSPWLRSHVDPLKQLADETRAQGLKFGIYYSLMDWYHHGGSSTGPLIGFTHAQMRQYVRDQITEMFAYLDPDLVWFDAFWLSYWSEADGQALYDHMRSMKPGIIVNNRVAKAQLDDGDYVTCEQFMAPPGADYVWEAAFPINDTWGYKSFDENWKGSATILHSVLYAASRGANFLLNFGPTGEGAIPQASLDPLDAVGDWLAANGDAVYGTTASPFAPQSWGWATVRGTKLYLLVAEWPADLELRFPSLENGFLRAYLFEDAEQAPLAVDATGPIEWSVTLPDIVPHPLGTVVVLEVDSPPQARPRAVGTMVNDTDPGIAYSPNIYYSADRKYGDYANDVHFSGAFTPNNGSTWAEFEFYGTGIGYVTERNVDQGPVDVYLDGELVATVDAYHPSIRMTQVELYRRTDLRWGTHRIKIVKRGGKYLVLDGFRVYARPANSWPAPLPRHLERAFPGWPDSWW